MAKGKQLGEFSLKFTTFVNIPGPAGDVHRQVTWEGPLTGFGTIFETVTFGGASKAGTYSSCGTAFMDNGDFLSGIGQGAYESTGKHRWRTAGFVQISDGRKVATEGEIDLAERSWKGKVFELN
jgi:hypothetical protein